MEFLKTQVIRVFKKGSILFDLIVGNIDMAAEYL